MRDTPQFRVRWKSRIAAREAGKHPEPFPNRQAARQWCRNHYGSLGAPEMTIIHPDGRREIWEPAAP